MASKLIAGNATNSGIQFNGDNTGALEIVTGSGAGTTALSIDSSQNVTVAGNNTVSGNLTVAGSITTSGGGAATLAAIKSTAANTPTVFQDSAGTQIGVLCRAWVTFNGLSGASPVIKSAFNVSSVTINPTGDYTLNFATSLPNADYAVAGMAQGQGNQGMVVQIKGAYSAGPATLKTTTQFSVITGNNSAQYYDAYVSVVVFG